MFNPPVPSVSVTQESTGLPKADPPKTQEDLNVEVYASVFLKCMGAAARILISRHGDTPTEESKDRQVTIAVAIFDRFYNDQSTIKAGANNAKAMIEGMTQVLEGRR